MSFLVHAIRWGWNIPGWREQLVLVANSRVNMKLLSLLQQHKQLALQRRQLKAKHGSVICFCAGCSHADEGKLLPVCLGQQKP